MKIFLSGSMAFAKEMLKVHKELEEQGHTAEVPYGTEDHINDPAFVEDLDGNIAYCIKHDVMRKCFQRVADCDGILVLNYKRKGIDGYIGISALMELGVAHFLKKKIFILYPIPDFSEHRWAHEVTIMQPVILHGDLSQMA